MAENNFLVNWGNLQYYHNKIKQIVGLESAITVSEQLTLTADSWVDNSQTVSFSVNTANRNVIDPVPESLEEWCRCGVYASAESADSVTFVCSEVPETDLNFKITSMVVSTNAG